MDPLKVNGEKDTIDRVFFNGDRLDEPYKDFPASWPGIFFRTDSKDNVLNYAVIRNAYQSLALENPSANLKPKLTLNAVSYTHLRAHETPEHLVCRLLLEKKK